MSLDSDSLSPAAVLSTWFTGRQHLNDKVILEGPPKRKNNPPSVRQESKEEASDQDSKYATEVRESTQDAIRDGFICRYCEVIFCWGGCHNKNPFDRVHKFLTCLRTNLPEESYWCQPEFRTLLAFWGVRMFNAFSSNHECMTFMVEIAAYLTDDILRTAKGQAGRLRSDLGLENNKSLDLDLMNAMAKVLGSVERDFYWISFRKRSAKPQNSELDEVPSKSEVAIRFREVEEPIPANLISALSTPRSKSHVVSKTKKGGDEKRGLPKASNATEIYNPPKSQRHMDNGDIKKPAAPPVSKTMPNSKFKRSLDIAADDDNGSSQGPLKKRQQTSPFLPPISNPQITVGNEQRAQPRSSANQMLSHLVLQDSPPWAYKHEPGHLPDLGLAVGEYDNIYDVAPTKKHVPSIKRMGQAIIQRVPGQRMKTDAMVGMIREWAEGKTGTVKSVKSTLSRSDVIESRGIESNDPWWYLKVG